MLTAYNNSCRKEKGNLQRLMMAIENKYIFFPVTKTGYWHNGIHIYKKDSEDFVISPFVGKILKKSQSIVSIYPEKLPKIIYVREIILTAPRKLRKSMRIYPLLILQS